MILNEKELEDYICENQDIFISTLKNIYGQDKNICFVGRQIKLGNENIADLIYYFDYQDDITDKRITREYIIIELKYRYLCAKDLSQLSRYMQVLESKLYEKRSEKYCFNVSGVFVSFGLTNEMQDISNLPINNIQYLAIKPTFTFYEERYSYSQEYIQNIKLDNRILDLNGEGDYE